VEGRAGRVEGGTGIVPARHSALVAWLRSDGVTYARAPIGSRRAIAAGAKRSNSRSIRRRTCGVIRTCFGRATVCTGPDSTDEAIPP